MEPGAIIFIMLFAIVISYFVLHAIIRSATNSKEMKQHAALQTRILIELARKEGIDPDALKQIEEYRNKMRPNYNANTGKAEAKNPWTV